MEILEIRNNTWKVENNNIRKKQRKMEIKYKKKKNLNYRIQIKKQDIGNKK